MYLQICLNFSAFASGACLHGVVKDHIWVEWREQWDDVDNPCCWQKPEFAQGVDTGSSTDTDPGNKKTNIQKWHNKNLSSYCKYIIWHVLNLLFE